MAVATQIEWRGVEEQQRAARMAYELLAARGRFYSENAPIRASVASLGAYFAARDELRLREDLEGLQRFLESSLEANPAVFSRESSEGGGTFATTKRGVAPRAHIEDAPNPHTFRTRLFAGSRTPTEEDLEAIRGGGREVPEIIAAIPEIGPVPAIFPAEEEADAPAPETERAVEALVEPGYVAEPEADEEPAAVAQPEVADAPAAAAPRDLRITLGGAIIDLADDPVAILAQHGDRFRALLDAYLEEDFRFVRFGPEFYVEERVERLSKGQLRDIKDYINERNQPLTDEELLSDALRRPLQDADYGLWRFTINFRLSREKKDFRFVGTAEDRLWATTALPAIGQARRKTSEIAQDYRYLLDPQLADEDAVAPASAEEASGRLELRHGLTWYESENGVLPVGPSAQLLMPEAMLEDQQVVVLRVQDPQNYATYFAELRLGGGARGTYIAGLEELFQTTLVPGAAFSLVQGGAANEFTIEYERQVAQEARLLQWDPRKEQWFFGPVVYECPVNPSALLTEERVGALAGRKRATEAERKRPEVLLQRAFELVGEDAGDGSSTALVDDLIPALNIERPISRRYLESLLESPQYPQFGIEDPSVGLALFRQG